MLVQPADVVETPTSLAFAVETTESTAKAKSAAADAALFSCSEAIVDFLKENRHDTTEDIEAIRVILLSGESDIEVACAVLQTPEELGLTQEDLMAHMLAEVPAEALGALVELSDVLMD